MRIYCPILEFTILFDFCIQCVILCLYTNRKFDFYFAPFLAQTRTNTSTRRRIISRMHCEEESYYFVNTEVSSTVEILHDFKSKMN